MLKEGLINQLENTRWSSLETPQNRTYRSPTHYPLWLRVTRVTEPVKRKDLFLSEKSERKRSGDKYTHGLESINGQEIRQTN